MQTILDAINNSCKIPATDVAVFALVNGEVRLYSSSRAGPSVQIADLFDDKEWMKRLGIQDALGKF